jgi:hypothetical protein
MLGMRMDTRMLIDAIVRQTTVLIAELATAGGQRAQLSHTANQMFVDLVSALKEQGLGSKVIADMFGLALRTYQTKLQRLAESRSEKGRSLWQALLVFIQENARERPLSRAEVLHRFRYDDELLVVGVLRDLVDSGLVYRTGRGDLLHYGAAQTSFASSGTASDDQSDGFVLLCLDRLAPVGSQQIAEALSVERSLVDAALERLLADGRVRRSATNAELYESEGCVLPLGSEAGWELAIFDHYQAMVMAICAKLRHGRRSAQAADLIGGSTFSMSVWPEHPYYEEATSFLKDFRARGTALRKKIATYNQDHPPDADEEQRLVLYAGQALIGLEVEEEAT